MGLIDWAKKKLKDVAGWVNQHIIQPGRRIAGNVVGAAKQLPGAVQRAVSNPGQALQSVAPAIPLLGPGSPLGASGVLAAAANAANKLPDQTVPRWIANPSDGSQVRVGDIPERIAQNVRSAPILGDIVRPVERDVASKQGVIKATGQALLGNPEGARQTFQDTPYGKSFMEGGVKRGVSDMLGTQLQVASTFVPAARGAGLLKVGAKNLGLGAAAGAGYEGGRQLQTGEKFNPVSLGVATGAGAAAGVAPSLIGAGVRKVAGLVRPTQNVKITPKSEPVTVTSAGAPELQGISGAEAKQAVGQIRNQGSVTVQPQNVITETVPSTLQRIRGARPETSTRPGVKIVDEPLEATQSVPTGGRTREYGRSQSIRSNPDVPDAVKEGLGQQYEQRQSAVATQDAYSALKNNPNSETEFVTSIDDAVAKKDVSDPTISDKIVALTQHYVDKGDDASLSAAAELTRKTQDLYAKAGQFNQAAANFDRLGSAGTLRYAEREAANANTKLSPEFRKYLVQKADELAQMPEGESKDLARFMLQNDIAKQLPVRFRDKVVTFWKSGLLTNPTTTAGNIMGNTGSAVGEKVSDLFATAIDAPLSVVTGKRSKAFSLRGGLDGTSEGFQKTWRYLKTGFDERRLPSKYDAPKIINNGNNPLGKALDFYENGVFRLMGAADMPFYYMRKANSLYEQGVVGIRNGTLKRSQLNEFVKNPTAFEGGEQALKNATSDASYAVFQNDTTLGKWAQDLANRSPALGEFIAPFRRTPSSIAMRLVDYSPVGAGRTIVSAAKSASKEKGLTQQAQRELVQGLGRAGTGTALMAAGAVLVDKGVMTLGYPEDQAEQRLWELEGKQPYSIKVDGKWRSLNYASPWGQLLASGGFFQKGYKDTGSYWQGAMQAAAGAAKTLTEMSFLRGVAAPLDAIRNPQIFAERYAEQTASSVVPGIVRNLATGLDPVKRDVEGAKEAFMSSVPGLREKLNPQLNLFGEPIPAPRGLAEQMFDPTRPSNVLTGNQELVGRLRETSGRPEGLYVPSQIDKKPGEIGGVKGVELNREQLLQLRQDSGQLFKQQLERAVRSPEYDSLSPELKKKVIEAASTDARAVGRLFASERGGIGDPLTGYDALDTRQKKLAIGIQPDYVKEIVENRNESEFEEANRPKISKEVERLWSEYNELPAKSQERRDFLAANPTLQDYWDNNADYLNAYRDKFGKLPFGAKEPFKRGGRGGFGRRRFTRKGRGGRKTVKITNPKLKTGVAKARKPTQKKRKSTAIKITPTKGKVSSRTYRAPKGFTSRRASIKIKKGA